MSRLRHPNVLIMIGVMEKTSEDEMPSSSGDEDEEEVQESGFTLVLEYMERGSLTNVLQKCRKRELMIPPQLVIFICREISRGMWTSLDITDMF